MNKTHRFEKKLIAAQRYLNGEASSQDIGKELGIDHHDVIIYALRYKRYGEDGGIAKQKWTKRDCKTNCVK